MRAVFNISCQVFNGPGGTPPNAFRGNVTGRLVPVQKIIPLTGAPIALAGYFTYNSPLITAGPPASVGNVIGWDMDLSSRLVFTTLGITLYVYWIERIVPFGSTSYRRAWVSDQLIP